MSRERNRGGGMTRGTINGPRLNLAGRGLATLPPLENSAVRRADVAGNALTTLRGFAELSELVHLDVARNALTSLRGLESDELDDVRNEAATRTAKPRKGRPRKGVGKLEVLVVSHNPTLRSLAGLPGGAAMRTIVANDCDIVLDGPALDVLRRCGGLETCILSRNKRLLPRREEIEGDGGLDIEALKVFESMPNLAKLCLADCGIPALPVEWYLPKVAELRLSKNSIKLFEEGVLLRSVKILDLSHNEIRDARTLRRARFLESLSITGNPCVGTAADAAQTIGMLHRMFPLLRHVTGADAAEFEAQTQSQKRYAEPEPEEKDVVIEAPNLPQTAESNIRKVRKVEPKKKPLMGSAVAEKLRQALL